MFEGAVMDALGALGVPPPGAVVAAAAPDETDDDHHTRILRAAAEFVGSSSTAGNSEETGTKMHAPHVRTPQGGAAPSCPRGQRSKEISKENRMLQDPLWFTRWNKPMLTLALFMTFQGPQTQQM